MPSVGPEWIKKKPRHSHAGALLAAAVSSDGQLLAVGGGDRRVHVWDTRSDTLIQSFPGHKDTITGMCLQDLLSRRILLQKAFKYCALKMLSSSAYLVPVHVKATMTIDSRLGNQLSECTI